ncbi:MAG: small subunit ribosomal protein [Archaeoglobaceae archaeon]|nr:small subunit ribosomal protein [Archaeoglobaceae archaeon]
MLAKYLNIAYKLFFHSGDRMFKHIVRITDTDLDGNRNVVHALTGITGIGIRMARSIVNELGLDDKRKLGTLSDEEIEKLRALIEEDIEKRFPAWMLNRRADFYSGKDLHLLSKDVNFAKMLDIERMMRMKCYRGVRHAKGKKVRGQRTRSTGRKGRTIGVVRKKT